MEVRINELVKSMSSDLYTKKIDFSHFCFEERVRLQCFHCDVYKVSWTCPPRIPEIDYQKIIQEYGNTLLVYCKMPFENADFAVVRRESTVLVHRALLGAEKLLWDNNHPLAVSFIGGSCKLCSTGCDPHGCRQPHQARIPMEATGMNVIETLKHVDININFPPKEILNRVGLLAW